MTNIQASLNLKCFFSLTALTPLLQELWQLFSIYVVNLTVQASATNVSILQYEVSYMIATLLLLLHLFLKQQYKTILCDILFQKMSCFCQCSLIIYYHNLRSCYKGQTNCHEQINCRCHSFRRPGNSWNLVGTLGNSWKLQGTLGILWELLGISENPQ